MQGWALGVVCLYVGLALVNWVMGAHWLAEFSWPLSILGGVGLAIASTPASMPSLAPDQSIEPIADVSPAAPGDTPSAATTDAAPAQAPGPNPAQPKQPSISFTINKNVRP